MFSTYSLQPMPQLEPDQAIMACLLAVTVKKELFVAQRYIMFHAWSLALQPGPLEGLFLRLLVKEEVYCGNSANGPAGQSRLPLKCSSVIMFHGWSSALQPGPLEGLFLRLLVKEEVYCGNSANGPAGQSRLPLKCSSVIMFHGWSSALQPGPVEGPFLRLLAKKEVCRGDSANGPARESGSPLKCSQSKLQAGPDRVLFLRLVVVIIETRAQ